MKRITFQPATAKALRKMPRNVSSLIVGKIKTYARDPTALSNNVKRLRGIGGQTVLRLRVGDWRVIMIDETVISVIRIAPRGSVYD